MWYYFHYLDGNSKLSRRKYEDSKVRFMCYFVLQEVSAKKNF